MIIYYIIILIMTFAGAFAKKKKKKASSKGSIINMLKDKSIYIGGIIYVTAALLNIYVLKYLDYSTVLPLTAITYIWTMVISYKILKEKITNKKKIGVILIILGAIVISI